MGPERKAWEKLRDGLLEKLGYVVWWRIESPLTASGFPDLLAIHASRGSEYIELKAWKAAEFRLAAIPWSSPAQLLTLKKIARARQRAMVFCLLNNKTWHVVRVLSNGELKDVTHSEPYWRPLSD